VITVTIAIVHAAYSVQRPITDGKIYQWYLYGEDGHKGVDFPAIEGTDVCAVADGVVMDFKESVNNGTGIYFGNFVLIRHTARHYVRHNNGQMVGQMGYVYSIYAHLSKNSVPDHINVGDTVTAGEKIAEVDDTGDSTGNHLHLQIMLDPSPDHNDGEDYAWTETTSRNPETWLTPFSNDTIQTASAIGKVTDVNGNPVTNLRIYGMQKPDGAIWNPSAYPYGYSETYNDDKENPDDILVENFATTDVDPDTYDLVAKHKVGDQWVVYEQLGSHTFTAGQTTYIGLYPVYLPDIMENYWGWNSSIVVRNNSDTKTAQVNTTFFWENGDVRTQKTDYIAPRGTVVVDFPGTCYYCRGSAIVSAGEDVSVVVVNTTTSKAYGYNGIAPAGGTGSPGFGVAGAEVHLPLVMNGHSSWYSHLAVQNTGAAQASVTVYFENHSPPRSYTITQAGGLFLDDLSFLGTPYLGSARITSDQPVAAMASHWKDTSSVHVAYAHSAYTSGTATNHLPLVFRRYNPTSNSGWCTGVDVRNLGISGTNVTLTYRPTNLGGTYTATKWVPANGGTNFWLPSLSGFPDGSYGVATLSAGQPLVSVVNTTKYASDVALSYNGFLDTDGTDAVILPLVYKGYSGWDTGVQVHNVGSQGTNVRIDYHATNGNWQCSDGPFAVASQEGHNFYQPSSCLPSGFVGSAVVTASGGDERIVAQVNAMNYGASYAVSYNGISR